MKDLNLQVNIKRRYKNTTDSNHNLSITPNILNRDFYASNPDEKYVGDITYIPKSKKLSFSTFELNVYL